MGRSSGLGSLTKELGIEAYELTMSVMKSASKCVDDMESDKQGGTVVRKRW